METFKKVIIKSEADLPKESGEYITCVKSTNHVAFREFYNGSKFWLGIVDWYLIPIEPAEVSEQIPSDVVSKMQHEFQPKTSTSFEQGMYSGYAFGLQDGYKYAQSQVSQEARPTDSDINAFYPVSWETVEHITSLSIDQMNDDKDNERRREGAKAMRDGQIPAKGDNTNSHYCKLDRFTLNCAIHEQSTDGCASCIYLKWKPSKPTLTAEEVFAKHSDWETGISKKSCLEAMEEYRNQR